jgi:hypothetical protein
MVSADIAEESVDGGEPDVARRDAVVALLLQIYKEAEDSAGIEIVHVQITDFDLSIGCHKAEQENQAVAVALNRVRAHPTEPRQMIGEVVPETAREEIR